MSSRISICFSPYSIANLSTKLFFQSYHLRSARIQQNSTKPAEFPSIPTNESTRKNILTLLNMIILSKDATAFLRPVDPIIDHAPEYREIIKNPMDLSTMRGKANRNEYQSFNKFLEDLNCIIRNAITYNSIVTHPVHKAAIDLSYFIYDKLIKLRDNPNEPLIQPDQERKLEDDADRQIAFALEDLHRKKREHKEKFTREHRSIQFSDDQYTQLENDIKNLPASGLMTVVEIIKKEKYSDSLIPLEINLRSLDEITIKKLRIFVSRFKKNKDKETVIIWRPAIPQNLQEIQDKYEEELLSWLKPPANVNNL